MIVPPAAGPDELARHLLFVAAPALWSAWPFLPLVRRANGAEELGVLFDARGACGLCGYAATVFRANLFALPPTLAEFLALPRDVYDAAEEVVRDGWRVD